MSRRVDLPSTEQIETAIRDLSTQVPESVLTVSALSKHLSLSKSTFWRHFPDIAQTVADNRRSALRADTKPVPTPPAREKGTDAKLREEMAILNSRVALAAAQVQRLTLENHALRRQLEAEHKIIHISRNQ